jgi:DNA-directed RNA polymerase subunit K/omega
MDVKLMEKMLDHCDNRYEGVMVVALEADRVDQLIKLSGEDVGEKPTTIGFRRVSEGKVKFKYGKEQGEE